MARGVSYQSGAEFIKYCIVNQEEDCFFDDTMENILSELENTFKSFERVPEFNIHCYNIDYYLHTGADRECWPVLKNGNCAVFASEYCGIFSLSFCPLCDYNPDDQEYKRGIQENWIRQVEDKINACIERAGMRLNFVDRFSNGECIYSRANPVTA